MPKQIRSIAGPVAQDAKIAKQRYFNEGLTLAHPESSSSVLSA
jgi:hypothetical protein